jgi:hypothetical protein
MVLKPVSASSRAPAPSLQRPRPPKKRGPQMIMRPGQQLLLPANPLFIWGSLLVALL